MYNCTFHNYLNQPLALCLDGATPQQDSEFADEQKNMSLNSLPLQKVLDQGRCQLSDQRIMTDYSI